MNTVKDRNVGKISGGLLPNDNIGQIMNANDLLEIQKPDSKK